MVDNSKMMVPALIGGLVSGILSAIPCCNILCCMWYMVGGAIAAYFLAKKAKIELKDGAIVGALSGVVSAILITVLGFVLSMLFSALGIAMGGAGTEEMLLNMGLGALSQIFWFFVYLFLGVIFGAVGGVIAVKLMEKR